MESYLLKTGKFRLFFSWYFKLWYGRDINVFMHFFEDWEIFTGDIGIRTAIEPNEIYKVLYLYGWSKGRFHKVMMICFYLGLIKVNFKNEIKTNRNIFQYRASGRW